MKTLIIEDDHTSITFLEGALSLYGQTDVARDGFSGLGMIMISDYDLICLDINMPGISGHEVLTHLRNYEALKGIPVGKGVKVFITSSSKDTKNVFSAFRENCDEYLPKPLDLNVLAELIAKHNLNQE